jgi:ABC-type bacteriocin/lantibiotic exporter with double-glycine peptidase domain
VTRVQELEQIRDFFKGLVLTSVLDFCFSFIFLLVIRYYSGWLTLVVLASLLCYAFWSTTVSPVLRTRLNDKFELVHIDTSHFVFNFILLKQKSGYLFASSLQLFQNHILKR